jgi:hypothetical protein
VALVIYLLMLISHAVAFSDIMMNEQLERKQKGVVMAQFQVLCQRLSAETEETHEKV